jgi:hypothetical protein
MRELVDKNGDGVGRRQRVDDRDLSRPRASQGATQIRDSEQLHTGLCEDALERGEVDAGVACGLLFECCQRFPVCLRLVLSRDCTAWPVLCVIASIGSNHRNGRQAGVASSN